MKDWQHELMLLRAKVKADRVLKQICAERERMVKGGVSVKIAHGKRVGSIIRFRP